MRSLDKVHDERTSTFFRALSQPWITAALAIANILLMLYLAPLFNAEFLPISSEGAVTEQAGVDVRGSERTGSTLSTLAAIYTGKCCCPYASDSNCTDADADRFAKASLLTLEAAYTPDCFCRIVATWAGGDVAQQAEGAAASAGGGEQRCTDIGRVVNGLKRMHLTFDFLFPIFYGLGLASLIAWIAQRHHFGGRHVKFLKALFPLPLIALVLDWIENALILTSIWRVSEPSDLGQLPRYAVLGVAAFAGVKWLLVLLTAAVAAAYLVASVVRTRRYLDRAVQP